jgi:gliding motility-associated-like protein
LLCSGQPMVFKAMPVNIVSPAYQWMVNGSSVASTATFSTNTLVNADEVSCRVSETQGCAIPSTSTITADVYATPVVGTVPPIILSKGQTVVLSLPVTGDIAAYNWSPPDGLSDVATSDPLATPLKSVTYALQVTSTDGCVASGSVMVKVFSQLAIPGAFSPNGDGHNDVFYVIGGPLGSTVKDLAVFDRWGRCVFQVHGVTPNDPAFGWDGRVAGQIAAPGTYVYEIMMSFADKTQQVFKGTVVLVR